MNENFKFEVGSTYENMKGPYEVVSIQKNSMVIRWKDGSEAETTVDLQMRIIERLAYEKEKHSKLKNDEPKPKKSSKKA